MIDIVAGALNFTKTDFFIYFFLMAVVLLAISFLFVNIGSQLIKKTKPPRKDPKLEAKKRIAVIFSIIFVVALLLYIASFGAPIPK